MRIRIALSVLPVVLIVGWLSLTKGWVALQLGALWAIVTLIAVGICVLLGRAAGASRATPLWITCLVASILLAGFCALTILSIGMLIAPLAIVPLTFSLINLGIDYRLQWGTR